MNQMKSDVNTRTAYKFPTSHILINKSHTVLLLACIFIILYIPNYQTLAGVIQRHSTFLQKGSSISNPYLKAWEEQCQGNKIKGEVGSYRFDLSLLCRIFLGQWEVWQRKGTSLFTPHGEFPKAVTVTDAYKCELNFINCY